MIPVKEAVKTAMNFVLEMFSQENLMGLRLEEVELSDDGNVWLVTLSFVRGTTPGALAASLGTGMEGREYKQVAVWSSTGEVRSVRIRQLV